jgi:hypothetical protein
MSFLLSLSQNHTALALVLFIATFINIALGFVFYKYHTAMSEFVTSHITSRLQFFLSKQIRIGQWIRRHGSWMYQRPVLVYSLIMLVWFTPLLISQHVILPFRPFIYANLEPAAQSAYIETTFYSDYISGYVPEVYLHMHAPRAGWLALWTNDVEFGKPLSHGSIFSPAYLPSWLMMQLSHDPYRYFTYYFVLIIYLTGVFAVLYTREITPQPGVALITGLLLAYIPAFFFWNTFHTFITPTTWGMALLYGLQRIRNQKSPWWTMVFVAFAMYSLIYTAYPQIIIQMAYFFVGYFGWQLWQLRTNHVQRRTYFMASITGIGLGVVSALPSILDIVTAMQLSALRQQINPQFFISVIPNINNVTQALGAVLSFGVSDIFQPITTYTKSMFPIKSGYITLIMLLFVMIGVTTQWRRVWGWVIWLLIASALSFRQDIFAFGYAVGLPQFSRGLLFSGASQQIPLIIIALYGVASLLSYSRVPSRTLILLTLCGGMQYVGNAVIYALWQGIPVQWPFVALELGVVLAVTVSMFVTHSAWRTLLIAGVILGHAQFVVAPLLLVQPQANIITTSPTAQAINASLPTDGVMAMITVKPTTRLEPNFSSVLHIRQIGAYSSLQSTYYVALMKRFNVNYDRYIRSIRSIYAPLPANDLWMTNIRTIVSDKPLTIAGLTLITRVDGLYLYQTADGMGCCLRVPTSALRTDSTTPNQYWIDNPQAATNQRLTKKEDYGDELRLEFPAHTTDSVIILNQQFHPDWIGQVQTAQGWQATSTIVINDVYQAVRIPAGATALSIQFRPWIRWSIVSNMLWLALGMIWVISKIRYIRDTLTTLPIGNKLV